MVPFCKITENPVNYKRLIPNPLGRSYLLLGPRGTGKSSWLTATFPDATYIDLLDTPTYRELLAHPEYLAKRVSPKGGLVIIDEVQRVPELFQEVHRLIEQKGATFLLSGSSARKLKHAGVNLLAGRALTQFAHPFTQRELGANYSHEKALLYGLLPEVWDAAPPKEYLESYVTTYLREEVQQEGLTRNLGTFSRFLEVISFSQAEPINIANIASEVGVDRKTIEQYVTILEDLLLAIRIPVFQKHARRELYQRAKFFLFDTGVYRTLRPRGLLDTPELIDGAALETLLFQQLRAYNDYYRLGFSFFYWRTRAKHEVDLVLYGEHGLIAIEVKRTALGSSIRLGSMRLFLED